eukprot:jgi/Chlat1/6132/Chrsp41S05694
MDRAERQHALGLPVTVGPSKARGGAHVKRHVLMDEEEDSQEVEEDEKVVVKDEHEGIGCCGVRCNQREAEHEEDGYECVNATLCGDKKQSAAEAHIIITPLRDTTAGTTAVRMQALREDDEANLRKRKHLPATPTIVRRANTTDRRGQVLQERGGTKIKAKAALRPPPHHHRFGVTWSKTSRMFCTHIYVSGKQLLVGCYRKHAEAVLAGERAERRRKRGLSITLDCARNTEKGQTAPLATRTERAEKHCVNGSEEEKEDEDDDDEEEEKQAVLQAAASLLSSSSEDDDEDCKAEHDAGNNLPKRTQREVLPPAKGAGMRWRGRELSRSRLGVTWCKKSYRYRVHIRANNERLYVGRYVTYEEAVRARERAEKERALGVKITLDRAFKKDGKVARLARIVNTPGRRGEGGTAPRHHRAGVRFRAGCYQVQISANRQYVYVGAYHTFEEAVCARERAEREKLLGLPITQERRHKAAKARAKLGQSEEEDSEAEEQDSSEEEEEDEEEEAVLGLPHVADRCPSSMKAQAKEQGCRTSARSKRKQQIAATCTSKASTTRLRGRTDGAKTEAPTRRMGVTWNKRDHIWRAHINVNGKNLYVGRYHAHEEAARAMDRAMREAALGLPITLDRYARAVKPAKTCIHLDDEEATEEEDEVVVKNGHQCDKATLIGDKERSTAEARILPQMDNMDRTTTVRMHASHEDGKANARKRKHLSATPTMKRHKKDGNAARPAHGVSTAGRQGGEEDEEKAEDEQEQDAEAQEQGHRGTADKGKQSAATCMSKANTTTLRGGGGTEGRAEEAPPRRVGVTWQKNYHRWQVQIYINKKPLYVGCCLTHEEAVRVVDRAERELALGLPITLDRIYKARAGVHSTKTRVHMDEEEENEADKEFVVKQEEPEEFGQCGVGCNKAEERQEGAEASDLPRKVPATSGDLAWEVRLCDELVSNMPTALVPSKPPPVSQKGARHRSYTHDMVLTNALFLLPKQSGCTRIEPTQERSLSDASAGRQTELREYEPCRHQ